MILLLAGACAPFNELVALATGEDPGEWKGDTAVEDMPEAPGAGFPFEQGRVFPMTIDLPPSSVEGLVYHGDYVPGVFQFAGLRAEVGVRLKGSSTFDDLEGKPSLKLNFGAFTQGNTFLGIERLTLNSMKFDPTMMRESVAYHLFEQIGVPASHHGYGTLSINGEPYGLYSIIETLDENFLRRAYPGDDDGYLYDSTFISADLTSAGVVNFELQEGDPATAYTDLDALVGEIQGGDITQVLDTRFDPSVWTYLAADLTTGNWDGYSRNTNNYLLYHATVADRWFFVPWGQDTAFRGGGPLYGGVRARVTSACVASESCRARLEEACKSVLTTWEEGGLLDFATEIAEEIAPSCAEDPRKREECDQEDILEAVANRPGEVRRERGW